MIAIYRASCENVHELDKQAKLIKRMINGALRKHRMLEVETLTKLYALLYSAYAEVSFIKLIHTPYGFTEDYIQQIELQRNLESKWKKCLFFALQKIDTEKAKGEVANKRQRLERIMEEYIITPSQIRNKVAHGQWKVCLNNDCTATNPELTVQIQQLDYAKIERLFNIYKIFSQCVEDLIESPERAHHRFYYERLVELETYIEKTKNYTIESKKKVLEDSCIRKKYQKA